jgi:glyoxylase-like metal-dependent hydrolase (beta-lactamase superfamily II)
MQAKNPKKATIVGVTDKYVLTDGKQTLVVHATEGDNHSDELMVGYLPAAKILIEADSFNPRSPNTSPPSPPNAVSLYNNIQRLKLDVATIAPIHGRGVAIPMSEFLKFIGKS